MRFSLKKLLAVLLLLKPFPLFANCENAADKAKKLYLNGKTPAALKILDECIGENPTDRKSLLFFIEILPEKRFPLYYKTLLNAADKAIKEKTGDYAYYLGLCKYYRNKNLMNNAFANCRKALMLEPTAYPVYRETGLNYGKINKSKKAIENFAQGIEISSANYKAHYFLAEEYLKSGKHKLALKTYTKALKIAPAGGRNIPLKDKIFKRVKLLKIIISKNKKKKREKEKTKTKAKNALYFDECVSDARKHLNNNNLEKAEAKISDCLKTNDSNTKALILSADISMRLGKYKTAIAEYKKALKLQKKPLNTGKTIRKKTETNQNPDVLAAFYHYKIGKAYFKAMNLNLAARHYQKALNIKPDDINVLLGMSECHEYEAKYKKAMVYYEKILQFEPSNQIAYRRIKELKVKTMNNKGIIKEMKLRGAISENTELLTKETKELFYLMRETESNYAISYLKSKNVVIAEKIIKIKNPNGKIRLFLNMRGFKIYKRLLTKDAINYFEKKGINLRDVFLLRDKSGKKIFDKKGKLTNSGIKAYWLASEEEKSWIMPYETPPKNAQDEKNNEKIEKARKSGYREISEPEFFWLLKATDCPVDILTPPENNYLRILQIKNRERYFLCYEGPCAQFENSNALSNYIERYRAGDDLVSTGKTSTAFFGSGAVEKRKFCHNGKIWR